jgi:hypothetical protein
LIVKPLHARRSDRIPKLGAEVTWDLQGVQQATQARLAGIEGSGESYGYGQMKEHLKGTFLTDHTLDHLGGRA